MNFTLYAESRLKAALFSMSTLMPDLHEQNAQFFHSIAISTMAHFCEALLHRLLFWNYCQVTKVHQNPKSLAEDWILEGDKFAKFYKCWWMFCVDSCGMGEAKS